MIRILSGLVNGAVAADIGTNSKSELLSLLATMVGDSYSLDSVAILDGLQERERLGPTGFGGGTAIPHCKLSTIDKPVVAFVRLAKPVDYDAVDDEPVDLVCALVSPTQDGAAHLRALAEVSRLLRDEKYCAQLRGAADSDALFALLAISEERDAA